jgi:hypothetical protein
MNLGSPVCTILQIDSESTLSNVEIASITGSKCGAADYESHSSRCSATNASSTRSGYAVDTRVSSSA